MNRFPFPLPRNPNEPVQLVCPYCQHKFFATLPEISSTSKWKLCRPCRKRPEAVDSLAPPPPPPPEPEPPQPRSFQPGGHRKEGPLLKYEPNQVRAALANHPELPERWKQILRLRFGLKDDKIRTLKEVAPLVGLHSPQRAGQLEKKALERIGL